jgi:hypothetical protein
MDASLCFNKFQTVNFPALPKFANIGVIEKHPDSGTTVFNYNKQFPSSIDVSVSRLRVSGLKYG